jgi:hypothetical protein
MGSRSVRPFQTMSEDDLEQVPDALKAYKKQLDLVKEDIEVLTLFSNPYLIRQVDQYTTGVPTAKPDVKEKCLRFLDTVLVQRE